MHRLRPFLFALTLLTLFAGVSAAQRTSSKRPAPKPTPRRVSSTLPPLEVRAARVKVSNQLYNVDQFVVKLVPIAQNIEAMDREIMGGKVKKESADLNQSNKKKVLTAISSMRAALTTLESEFKTKPDLRRYLINIQGITDLAVQSEDSAIAGKFVASVDPLRSVSRKLNETLAALPNAEL